MDKKKRLAGAKFVLLNCRGKEIACGVTNKDGELFFDCLPFGRYFIKEIEAPCGYEKCDKISEICLNCERPHRCVEFMNEKKKGSIKILKFGRDDQDEDEDGDDDDEGKNEDNRNCNCNCR